jgi:hypothetical protein
MGNQTGERDQPLILTNTMIFNRLFGAISLSYEDRKNPDLNPKKKNRAKQNYFRLKRPATERRQTTEIARKTIDHD